MPASVGLGRWDERQSTRYCQKESVVLVIRSKERDSITNCSKLELTHDRKYYQTATPNSLTGTQPELSSGQFSELLFYHSRRFRALSALCRDKGGGCNNLNENDTYLSYV
jgi:hypothetical protein